MEIMTFGEFLNRWKPGSALIAPRDYDTRDRNELGVINGREWERITFSPVVGSLTGAFVRSQILEYCENQQIGLTDEQIREAQKGVEYAVTEMIGDSIDTALDMLELDREIVIHRAWATREPGMEYGDIYTDFEEATKLHSVSGLIEGFTVSAGKDFQALVEDLFNDFYEDKDELTAVVVENGLTKYINDLSEN